MTAEPKPKLGPAGPAPSPVGEGPRPGEQFFKQSIADLSRRLGERKQGAADPQTAAEARRRAMQAYERERLRKLRLILTGAGAVFATAGFAWLMVMLGEPEEMPASIRSVASVRAAPPPPSVVAALAEPAAAPSRPAEPPPAAQAVTESQPPVPAPAVQPDSPPPSPPAAQTARQTAAAVPDAPPDAAPAPTPAVAPPPLSREGIREVQKRLAGFGFDPGPIDGVAGRKTEQATQRYLETRGQSQMPPNDPQMLQQLRQDPAPQVAPTQVAQRPSSNARSAQTGTNQPARRQFDPFEPVKVAGTEITRFFQSVFR
jgi:putative peptidoglycan binding protein